jgi:hypothetical protein
VWQSEEELSFYCDQWCTGQIVVRSQIANTHNHHNWKDSYSFLMQRLLTSWFVAYRALRLSLPDSFVSGRDTSWEVVWLLVFFSLLVRSVYSYFGR